MVASFPPTAAFDTLGTEPFLWLLITSANHGSWLEKWRLRKDMEGRCFRNPGAPPLRDTETGDGVIWMNCRTGLYTQDVFPLKPAGSKDSGSGGTGETAIPLHLFLWISWPLTAEPFLIASVHLRSTSVLVFHWWPPPSMRDGEHPLPVDGAIKLPPESSSPPDTQIETGRNCSNEGEAHVIM